MFMVIMSSCLSLYTRLIIISTPYLENLKDKRFVMSG